MLRAALKISSPPSRGILTGFNGATVSTLSSFNVDMNMQSNRSMNSTKTNALNCKRFDRQSHSIANPLASRDVFFRHNVPLLSPPSKLITGPLRTTYSNNDIRRMMSIQKKANEGSSEQNNMRIEESDMTLRNMNNNSLLLMGFTTVLTALAFTPEAVDQMRSSGRDYNEIDPEDDFYMQMSDVSNEVRGEITRTLLGEELSDLVDAENKIAGNTADVVADVLNSEALQNAIASLITRVVSSQQFQSACQNLIKNLWKDLVNDPETVAQIIALLNTAIQDEKIKKSFKELVLGVLQDEEVYNELTGLVVRLGEEKEVLNATKELLTESAHQALNDPEILDHSMEFATDIVGDNVIQRTSGEALRNTVTYAVRPSLSTFLSMFGVTLLVISASALGHARMAAREGNDMDMTTSMVLQNIGESLWEKFLKVGRIPSNALAALGATITDVLLSPLRVVGQVLLSVGQTGNAAINAIQSFLSKIVSSPGLAMSLLKSSLTSLKYTTAQWIQKIASSSANLPSIILIKLKEGLVILAHYAGNKSVSILNVTYSTFCQFSAETLKRSSTSFGIISRHLMAQIQFQRIKWGDTAQDVLRLVLSALSNLMRRGSTGSI